MQFYDINLIDLPEEFFEDLAELISLDKFNQEIYPGNGTQE